MLIGVFEKIQQLNYWKIKVISGILKNRIITEAELNEKNKRIIFISLNPKGVVISSN